MFFRKRILLLLIFALVISPLSVSQIYAQSSNQILLSVAIPSSLMDTFKGKVISDFEAQYPNVSVQIVSNSPSIPSAAQGLDAQLAAASQYVSSADVLYVDSSRISVEATRAGYFLDLAPLVNGDKTLNTDDFYPTVWSAFQWDKGVWALPAATNTITLAYKASAFDSTGIAYPSDKWTISDFDSAVRKLAVKDPSGKVITPGVSAAPSSLALLFRTLANESFYDPNSVPNPPQFQISALPDILKTWANLDADGLVSNTVTVNGPNQPPLTINNTLSLQSNITVDASQRYTGVLLPGGKAGLNVQGFAVSAGTEHPDLAYAFARFLTTRADISAFSVSPARKSLAGNGVINNAAGLGVSMTPDIQALVSQGIPNGISLADLRYADYLAIAVKEIEAKTDPQTAVNDAEIQAITNVKAADTKRATLKVTIIEPQPQVSNVGGKAVLNFGVSSFQNPLPQQDKWTALIRDFVANDPHVGQINLTTMQAGQRVNPATMMGGKYDCFYLPTNGVPGAPLDQLLPLDPLMAADTTFDKNDVVGNTLSQLTQDNKIWAMPVVITPTILKYDPLRFSQTGLPAPTNSWTINQFTDDLKALRGDLQNPAPFIPTNSGGSYTFILIAAYGGLPLDYRVDPVKIDYTSAANATAIKQVLDLAKNKYIQYTPLGGMNVDFGPVNASTVPVILNATLNGFNIRATFGSTTSDPTQNYKWVMYPKGNQFTGMSYDIGTAYIDANAKFPDACYRWISTLAKHPELFNGMPTRRSLIGDPTIAASNGPDLTAAYQQIATTLQDPNTVAFPSMFSALTNLPAFVYQHWLFQAFDNYVLQDGDLNSGLKDAEVKSKAVQGCLQNVPPMDRTSPDTMRQYLKTFSQCVSKVDPVLGGAFGSFSK
jgi:ABC-type glycerol-3-phosphate transport system substrate-binding protein